MDFISPTGDPPYNNKKDDEDNNHKNKEDKSIKVNEDNDMKNNKPIVQLKADINEKSVYEIEYEETLSKNQQKEYDLKKEGYYCLTRCCFKNNIKIFFILNSFIFFFMIITAVFQVTAMVIIIQVNIFLQSNMIINVYSLIIVIILDIGKVIVLVMNMKNIVMK